MKNIEIKNEIRQEDKEDEPVAEPDLWLNEQLPQLADLASFSNVKLKRFKSGSF